jgi:putative ABC transport system permease protein
MRLLNHLLFWIRRNQLQAELDEELDFHRAKQQESLEQSGLAAEDAARAAKRTLGNVTLAREDARRTWIAPWIDSLRQDVAYALRTVRMSPAFAASMVTVTALGIAATTAVFGLIDGLVLAGLPVRDPSQLVWFRSPSFSYPVFTAVDARSDRLFSGFFAWNLERRHVQWQDALEPSDILTTSGDFYRTLGVQAVAGRTFGPEDDQVGGGPNGAVAVISDACWRRRFNRDPSAIGRIVHIEDVAFTVIGVTPPGFFGVAPGIAPEITIPLTTMRTPESLGSTSSSWLHMMGRLRDGVTLQAGNTALQSIWPAVLESTAPASMPRERRTAYVSRATALEPGKTGFSRVRNQFQEPLWVLLGLGGLLSAGASASAATLLLARGLTRRREVAVRLAIGASRARVIRQCLIEATVWTAIGAGLGIVLASWSAGALVAAISTWRDPIALDVAPNARILLFASGLALLTAWLGATPSAVWITRNDPNRLLKAGADVHPVSGRHWPLGSWIVAGQVALTIVLLVGASLFVASLRRLASQDTGFDRDNILVVSADAEAAGYKEQRLLSFYNDLRDRLSRLPGVQSASLSMYPPISDRQGQWTQSIGIDGAPVPADTNLSVHFNVVSPGYFGTLGMRLLAGRDFDRRDDERSGPVVVVNESLARRFFQDGRALGRRITMGRNADRRDLEIVGIVADAKYQRLQEPTRSIAYLSSVQQSSRLGDSPLVIELRVSEAIQPISRTVLQEIGAVDRRVPVRLQTVTDRIDESLVRERVMAHLSVVLGLTALVLACAAVYGLLGCTVSRLRKEIGVRMALGARRSTLLGMVLSQSLALGVAGSIAGLGASFALGRFVRTLLFQIEPSNPPALAMAVVVAIVALLAAAWLPARRAATVDPIAALREE